MNIPLAEPCTPPLPSLTDLFILTIRHLHLNISTPFINYKMIIRKPLRKKQNWDIHQKNSQSSEWSSHLARAARAHGSPRRAVADVLTSAVVVAARVHPLAGGLVRPKAESILASANDSLRCLRTELTTKGKVLVIQLRVCTKCYPFILSSFL